MVSSHRKPMKYTCKLVVKTYYKLIKSLWNSGFSCKTRFKIIYLPVLVYPQVWSLGQWRSRVQIHDVRIFNVGCSTVTPWTNFRKSKNICCNVRFLLKKLSLGSRITSWGPTNQIPRQKLHIYSNYEVYRSKSGSMSYLKISFLITWLYILLKYNCCFHQFWPQTSFPADTMHSFAWRILISSQESPNPSPGSGNVHSNLNTREFNNHAFLPQHHHRVHTCYWGRSLFKPPRPSETY